MKFTLQLSQDQLLIINQALNELPYKAVAPLFDELNRQIKEQMTPQAVPDITPADPQTEAKAA